MAATANTTLTYPLSDFTTSSGVVNPSVLLQEMKNAGLAAETVALSDDCTIAFTEALDDAEITTADGVVAVHAGTGFSSTIQREVSEAEESDDSDNEQVKLTLATGVLPAGDYRLSWYQELATTTNTGTSAARGLLYVTKNGGARIERAQSNNGENQWKNMSGGLPEVVKDGDSYVFELTYERIGQAGNAARARRARIGWVQL